MLVAQRCSLKIGKHSDLCRQVKTCRRQIKLFNWILWNRL